MKYIADLHVHSSYSMATSKIANLEGYSHWGKIKGINVIGTGDFTHPAYFAEIKDKLHQEENGFFTLKDVASPGIQFCLSAEISSIYKKHDKTRKVHSIIFAPTIDAAGKIRTRLEAIGNIHSDGRPILGLDPKNLLDLIMQVSDEAYLIPAHIWTPWFSLFGSKSGFDDIEECFEELTPHIFALETGLSSDPEMNWRWSSLDRYTLVSNSDAHSPGKLGREANLFDTELSYQGMFAALKTRKGFLGTMEFFPEEGKYHLDGHRKCRICLEPEKTRELKGLCPACGKTLTIGVMHRVLELADRAKGEKPRTAKGFKYIIPLPEIIGEITGKGTASKSVEQGYNHLISLFGDEFTMLLDTPLEEIQKKAGTVYAEAIRRMRTGSIHPVPGYDGEFGIIKVFQESEIDQFLGQDKLFAFEAEKKKSTRSHAHKKITGTEAQTADSKKKILLNTEQNAVLALNAGALLIKAGPGTGKTRTLTSWIEHLITSGQAAPGEILAITFTNKAAREMEERLAHIRTEDKPEPLTIATFHSFCYDLLTGKNPGINIICDTGKRRALLSWLLPEETRTNINRINRVLESHFENPHTALDPDLVVIKETYLAALKRIGGVDLSGLITTAVELLDADHEYLASVCGRYRFIAVDELQDINRQQFELISRLAAGQCVLAIGDPDQGIYGFRGSEVNLFFRFRDQFQATEQVLVENYRSAGNILTAAGSVISRNTVKSGLILHANRPAGEKIRLITAVTAEQEAAFLIREIEQLVGGLSMTATDALSGTAGCSYAFSDIAVLYRIKETGKNLLPFFRKAGIPAGIRQRTPLLEQEPYTLFGSIISVMLNEQDFPALQDALAFIHPEAAAGLKTFFRQYAGSGTVFRDFLARSAAENSIDRALYEKINLFLVFLDELKVILAEKGLPALLETVCTRCFTSADDANDHFELECILEMAGSFGTDLGSFYKKIILNPNESEYPYKTDKINFLTFHASKGLEFPVVFIMGAEEGITPLDRDDTDPEEERRLFYVSMTRAMDRLYISHLEKRRIYGKITAQQPSRFLQDLPANTVQHISLKPQARKEEYRQPSLF